MPIISCPHCQQHLSVQAEHAGLQCKCPHCSGLLVIPTSESSASKTLEQDTLPPTAAVQIQESVPPTPPVETQQAETMPPSPQPQQNTATIDPSPVSSDVSKRSPSTVPGYEILGELGRGGMGVVYKAKHLRLNRIVALKMILSGGHASSDDLVRFLSEAEAVAAFQHPNIVQVFDSGQHDGLPYMALEYVTDGSLADKLKDGPLSAKEAARIVEQIARGMNAAHQGGIVHRDLKPDNVLLTDDGTPKVTDFGLAKKVEGGSGLTQSGAIMGTPSYMAPEQAGGEGKRVGPAADVYALGAILYACLIGRPPFQADSVMNTILQVMSREPTPLRQLNKNVPADLETICLKSLEKDPLKRYTSANDLGDDLQRWQTGAPIMARPVGQVERIVKWSKRKPMQAAFLTTMVVFLLFVGIGGPVVAVQQATLKGIALEQQELAEKRETEAKTAQQRAEHLATKEAKAKQDAIAAKHKADKAFQQARASTYATQLLLATTKLRHGFPFEAQQILEMCESRLRGWEHFYLTRLCSKKNAAFADHTGNVLAVQFTPDGERIVSGDSAKIVIVRDRKTGKVLWTSAEHSGEVTCVTLTPDGEKIISGGTDSKLIVWNTKSGKIIRTQTGHSGPVLCIAVTPDGKHIVSGSADKTIKVWQIDSGKEVFALKGHFGWVLGVAVSSDGRQIASSSGDMTVRIWDMQTKKQLHMLMGHLRAVRAVTFSPDNRRIISGSQDKTVKVWDSTSGLKLLSLQGHLASILKVAYAPDGKRFLTASQDGTLRIWDSESGHMILSLRGHEGGVWDAAFRSDGKQIVSGGLDKKVILWDVDNSMPLRFRGLDCKSVVFNSDGKWIAVGGLDENLNPNINVWDITTGQQVRSFPGKTLGGDSLAFCANGKQLVSAEFDRTIRIFDIATGQVVARLRGHGGSVKTVAVSPDGKWVASGCGIFDSNTKKYSSGEIKLWDTSTRKEIWTLKKHKQAIKWLAFSPDGRKLISSSGTTKVWDVTTRKLVLTLNAASGPVAFSPDGNIIVTSSAEKLIKIWDGQSGKLLHALKGHTSRITGIIFSPDGKRVISSSFDGTIRIWDKTTGRQLLELEAHSQEVNCIAMSPDGKKIAIGGLDEVKIWDTTIQ